MVLAFTVLDDQLDEAAETFTVALSNLQNAVTGPNNELTVAIEDSDAPPAVAFETAASSGSGSAANAALSLKLSAVSGQAVMVGYQITGGSATNGADYKPPATPGTIPAGQTTASLPLFILNDWTPEPNETLVLKLASVANATVGAGNVHTYTITNDDKVRLCQGKAVTIYGTPGKDKLNGTAGIDAIDGMGGDDSLIGRAGNDRLCGGNGKDTLRGGPGADLLLGGNGADLLRGGGGNDTLFGKGGADTLRGELGRDRLSGGAGKPDVCDGGPSTDSLLAKHGCESVVWVP